MSFYREPRQKVVLKKCGESQKVELKSVMLGAGGTVLCSADKMILQGFHWDVPFLLRPLEVPFRKA